MRNESSAIAAKMPTGFDELNALHPLRAIRDGTDLRNAGEMMDRLAVLSRRTKDQNDYLETLTLITEAYESEEIEDALDRSKSSGLEALKYLMEAQGMRQAGVRAILGVGSSAVSMILSGERPITAEHARRLGDYFGVSPGRFFDLWFASR
jgi:HTH-type transcriptional regulator/antitoxin HigA